MMKMTKDFEREPALKIHEGNRYEIYAQEAKKVITFPEGILGFEEVHQYVLQFDMEIRPFLILQSIDHPELSFVCVESFGICKDFAITIPDTCAESLGLKDEKDSLVLSLVTVRREIADMTANLMSPIVVNLATMQAKQVIISNSPFPIKYNIMKGCQELMASREAEEKAG